VFTGIIEEKGQVAALVQAGTSSYIKVACRTVLEGTKIGDSIAVNGVCLTVTSLGDGVFTADIMPETVRRTNLRQLHNGSSVNLERAMQAGGRFGGHIVTGHIDGTGTVRSVQDEGNAVVYTIAAPQPLIAGIVEKGSVAVDGISLTVVSVQDGAGGDGTFAVSVIPHTREQTVLAERRKGSTVNIECDIVGKYILRLAKTVPGMGAAQTVQGELSWKKRLVEQDLLQ
jgi:riboflavin synthase